MDLDSRRQAIPDFTRQHFGHAGTRVYREQLTAGSDRRNKIEISAETVMGLLSYSLASCRTCLYWDIA